MLVSKNDAIKAVEICLDNTLCFIVDAEVLRNANKLDNLWIQYQFAFEELGKTNAMLTQLENDPDDVQMNNEIRTKHRIQMTHIRNLANLPPETKQNYKDAWKDMPISPDGSVFPGEAGELQRKLWDGIFDNASKRFVKIDEQYLNHFLAEGDQLRKDCRVNFKEDGKPYRAERITNGEINVILTVLNWLIENFRTRLSNLS